jgi:hypothetical protein
MNGMDNDQSQKQAEGVFRRGLSAALTRLLRNLLMPYSYNFPESIEGE